MLIHTNNGVSESEFITELLFFIEDLERKQHIWITYGGTFLLSAMKLLGIVNFIIVILGPILLEAEYCVETFAKSELTALPGPRAEIQQWELTHAGHIITAQNQLRVIRSILSRDGNYPFFITKDNQVIISHRLPNWNASQEGRFLATHRSLAKQFLKVTGEVPIIFYSGQLKIIGGKPESFIDQSGTFHELVRDLGDKASDAQLISSNQSRINFAYEVLDSIGLINSTTNPKNFWEIFHEYKDVKKRDAHQSDYVLARFELFCRQSSCWDDYLVLQKLINDISSNGGDSYILGKSKNNKELLLEWGREHQFVVMARSAGVMELLYRSHDKAYLRRLVENIEEYRRVLGMP